MPPRMRPTKKAPQHAELAARRKGVQRNQRPFIPPASRGEFYPQLNEHTSAADKKSVGLRTRGSPEVIGRLWDSLPGCQEQIHSPKGMVYIAGLGRFFEMAKAIGDTQRSVELVKAFREFWWETTHSFHFSWGEATVTPYDFAAITGLPFTTEPLYVVEPTLAVEPQPIADADFMGLLGFVPQDKKGNGYELGELHGRIGEQSGGYPVVFDDSVESRLRAERLARAFVWVGLSDTLFVNSASIALISLLELLRVWDTVGTLSWGEAGLAEMYLALDDVSRGKAMTFNCCHMALEAWAYEIFGCYAWQIREEFPTTTFPALRRWVKDARKKTRAAGARCRVTASYQDTLLCLRGTPQRLNLFPWTNRYDDHDLDHAAHLTECRKLLVGLSGDALYLGERFYRQHGPDRIAQVPVDPPEDMWLPRKLKDLATLIQGDGAYNHVEEGGDYTAYVAERLRSPQVIAGCGAQGACSSSGFVARPPLPPPYIDYWDGDHMRRAPIDMSRIHPHFQLPEGSRSVSAQSYRRFARAYTGALDMIGQLQRSARFWKERCISQTSDDDSSPSPSERKRTRVDVEMSGPKKYRSKNPSYTSSNSEDDSDR